MRDLQKPPVLSLRSDASPALTSATVAVKVKWAELLTFLLCFLLVSNWLHSCKTHKCSNNFQTFHLLSTAALNVTLALNCSKWPIGTLSMWIYDVGGSLLVWSVFAVRAAVVFEFEQEARRQSDSFYQTRHCAPLSTYNLVCVASCWNEVSHAVVGAGPEHAAFNPLPQPLKIN